MSDLFRKLNTLVRAQIEGFIEDDLRLPVGRKRRQQDIKPGDPRVSRDIQLLREQIDEALDREESLQEQLDALRQDADDLNQKADQALVVKDEDEARHRLALLRQNEQQITMLEADITRHRQMTAALMDQVNILESQLAAANSQQASAEPSTTEPVERVPIAIQGDAAPTESVQPSDPVIRVPIVVDLAAETEEQQAVSPESPAQATPPIPPVTAPPPEDADLASRRARLARRDPPQEE